MIVTLSSSPGPSRGPVNNLILSEPVNHTHTILTSNGSTFDVQHSLPLLHLIIIIIIIMIMI